MRHEVEIEFNRCISAMFPKMPDDQAARLRKWLLEHERKAKCVDNLCQQIQIGEGHCNIGGKFDRKRFDTFIAMVAKMFAQACINHEEQQAMSAIKRQKLADDAAFGAEFEAEQAELQKELASTRIVGKPIQIVRP